MWLHYQKSSWCLGSHDHVRSQMCVLYRSLLWATGLWHMDSPSYSLGGQFVSIRRELKECKYTYAFSLWTKQKYILFMWNKWKITFFETWEEFVSSTQRCYQFQYIKFLKLYSMKPSLYGWSKVYQRSVSVVLNHFWFADHFVSVVEHYKFWLFKCSVHTNPLKILLKRSFWLIKTELRPKFLHISGNAAAAGLWTTFEEQGNTACGLLLSAPGCQSSS